MEITRPAHLEINLNNLQYNIDQIQKKVGENVRIMPVIKASGYGTYINRRLDVINQFDIVAVANVDEGVELRELGYEIALLLQDKNLLLDKSVYTNFDYFVVVTVPFSYYPIGNFRNYRLVVGLIMRLVTRFMN